ncbi:hypothetical protein C9J12_25490 [Photobacterium frigidiphilum]|uniref:Uncharacterized protein n=1 Tax=Photobacterium frigidiphilum TaxID=264736 RepID=A0A2T3J7V0_9GAMM|nr:hypothetical protein [Photobacterium frigidiphilum]PSU44849.1 hypothetical protein C9J12_25490 [Photobacterium frigidiphilum]
MNTQIHTSAIRRFYHHLNRFYANPLSILLSLAAGFIVVLLNNDVPYSSVRGWGTSEIDTILKFGLLFNLLMLLGSWWVVTARPKNYDIIEPKIKPLVDTMNNTGLIQTIASCEGHSLPGKPPYVYFRTTVEFAAQLEKQLRANLSHPKMRALWCIEGNFNPEEELVFTLFSPVYHSRLYALRHTVEFWLFRKQVDKELLFLAQLVNKAAESYTGARLKDIEHPPAVFDYQSGYIEMRNMTAFILNIVAGEIDDGSLRVDGDMAWYTQAAIDNNDPRIEQQKKKARQALSITHTLLKRSAPVSLRQHDKLLEIYSLCLNAITSQEGERKVFVDHSETLDDIRFPPELFDEY